MHAFERVLLYAVALVCAVMLMLDDRSTTDRPDEADGGNRGVPSSALSKASGDFARGGDGSRGEATDEAHTSIAEAGAPLVVSDRHGRARIVLGVNDADQPAIVMKDAQGRVVAALEGVDSAGRLKIVSGSNEAVLEGDGKGALHLHFHGAKGADLRVALTRSGTAEVSLRGSRNRHMVFMTSDADDAASVGIRRETDATGPWMRVEANGDATIGIPAVEGASGPVMRRFRDGLAEIAIYGEQAQGGPGMLRMPDGVSVVAVRRPSGRPGASMIASPNGASVVAVTSDDGARRAELRLGPDGRPVVALSDPDSEAESPKSDSDGASAVGSER